MIDAIVDKPSPHTALRPKDVRMTKQALSNYLWKHLVLEKFQSSPVQSS